MAIDTALVLERARHRRGCNPGRGRLQPAGLVADQLFDDVSAAIDDDMISARAGRDHPFTEPIAGGDDDLVGEWPLRIGGEEHAGDLGRDHALNDHRHADVGGGQAARAAIDAGGITRQRRPALDHCGNEVGLAADPEAGVIDAGEARPGQIFERRRAAHRQARAGRLELPPQRGEAVDSEVARSGGKAPGRRHSEARAHEPH